MKAGIQALFLTILVVSIAFVPAVSASSSEYSPKYFADVMIKVDPYTFICNKTVDDKEEFIAAWEDYRNSVKEENNETNSRYHSVIAEENNSTAIDPEPDLTYWMEPPDDWPERVSTDPKDEGVPGVRYYNLTEARFSGLLPYKSISTKLSPYMIRFEYSGNIGDSNHTYSYLKNPEININSTYICMLTNVSN